MRARALLRRVEDVLGEADAAFGLVHALRRARIDAPLVVAPRLPGPILGIADLVALVHLLDLGGVFDHHFLGADEIGEDVVAGPVPADAPFDRMAVLAQPAAA